MCILPIPARTTAHVSTVDLADADLCPATPEANPQYRWSLLHSSSHLDEQSSAIVEHVARMKQTAKLANSGDLPQLISHVGRNATADGSSLSAPQINFHMTGAVGSITFHRMLRNSIPDLHLDLDDIVLDGPEKRGLCIRITASGTQVQPFLPFLPIGVRTTFCVQGFFQFGANGSKKATYFFPSLDPFLTLIRNMPSPVLEQHLATDDDIQLEKNLALQTCTKQMCLQSDGSPAKEDDFQKLMAQLESRGGERSSTLEWIAANAWPLSSKSEGSRLLQKALELADTTEQCMLVQNLKGHVQEAATLPLSNHVIQRCIEVMRPSRLQFIIDELRGHAVEVAQTRCGCRVLERVLEYCSERQVRWLMEEMLIQPMHHCKHPFANFVMKHIFVYGKVEHQRQMISAIAADIFRLAKHRVANHVVRCVLANCDEIDRGKLAEALGADSKALAELRYHPYGSFIFRELRRGSKA